MEYKGYNVVPARGAPLLEIKAKGQGQVPAKLGGKYTTRAQAEAGIDRYLNSLIKGKKSNGKAKNSNTG
jgi:hypothetical protein